MIPFHFFRNRHHSTYIGKPAFGALARRLLSTGPFCRHTAAGQICTNTVTNVSHHMKPSLTYSNPYETAPTPPPFATKCRARANTHWVAPIKPALHIKTHFATHTTRLACGTRPAYHALCHTTHTQNSHRHPLATRSRAAGRIKTHFTPGFYSRIGKRASPHARNSPATSSSRRVASPARDGPLSSGHPECARFARWRPNASSDSRSARL